jgi:protein gp37
VGDKSKIEWTDASWNPVTGCSKVSPGCAHCYAETLSLRHKWSSKPWTPANAAENVVLHPERLDQPLRWRRPRMVFVNSMSDLFHEQVPDDFIRQVFDVMRWARQHTFQVLTKRPERIRPFLERYYMDLDDPPPHIWMGVSIENRRFVHRADVLREVPAAVRFISAEPLLGPLIATQNLGYPTDYGTGYEHDVAWEDGRASHEDSLPSLRLGGIDWLIVGGESGPGHRPINVEWVRDLQIAARGSDTAFFLKQMGGYRPGTELEDLPEGLGVREMPHVA